MRAYHCFVTGMVIELLVGHGGGGELQGCEEYCVACQEEARCSDARPRRPQGAAPGRVRRAHSILKPGPPKKCTTCRPRRPSRPPRSFRHAPRLVPKSVRCVIPFLRPVLSLARLGSGPGPRPARKWEGVTAPGCSLPGQRLFCLPAGPRARAPAIRPYTLFLKASLFSNTESQYCHSVLRATTNAGIVACQRRLRHTRTAKG